MVYYSRSLTRNRDNIWEVGFLLECLWLSIWIKIYSVPWALVRAHMRSQKVFRVYHLAWSSWHLLRVEKVRPADWLVWQSTSKFVARQVVCLMKNGQQSQNLSLKVDPSSNFRNNFLQPATNAFVARQVYHSWWKTGNIDEKLQRNYVARQAQGFPIPYFAALSENLLYVWLK